jgi:hypothetical protein
LKRSGKGQSDERYLKELGAHIAKEISKKGYVSPYDFWIKKAEGQFSRTTLTYILNGRIDPKVTTLRAIARLLKMEPKALLDFEGSGTGTT